MKKLLLLISFAFVVFNLKAQTADTLDYVNHYGTVFPVLHKSSLSNTELKALVKDYPEALKDFRKMRLLKHTEVALFVLSIVPLVYAIGATEESQFWIGIGLSGLISGVSYAMITDPYNRRMRKTIDTYNRIKIEEQKTAQ